MRYLMLLLLLCLTINVFAQEPRILANEALQVAIGADASSIVYYAGLAGETIHISAEAIEAGENTPDLVLWVVFNGHVLAYNNNQGDSPSPFINLDIAANGLYAIYVDSFNGVSEGRAELFLERVDRFHLEISQVGATNRILIDLPANQVFRHSFGASGDMNIIARDLSGNLDPYISLLNGAGDVLAANDDHLSNDLSLDVFDAQLSIRVGAALYVLEVRDLLGNAGQLEILITP